MAWNFVQHLPGESVLTARQKVIIHYTCLFVTHQYELKPGLAISQAAVRARELAPTVRMSTTSLESGVWMLRNLYRILLHGEPAWRTFVNGWHSSRPALRRKVNEVLRCTPLTWDEFIPCEDERRAFLTLGMIPPSFRERVVWDVTACVAKSGTPIHAIEKRSVFGPRVLGTIPNVPAYPQSVHMHVSALADLHRSLVEQLYPAAHPHVTALTILLRVRSLVREWVRHVRTHHGVPAHVARNLREHAQVMRTVLAIIERAEGRTVSATCALVEVRSVLEASRIIEVPETQHRVALV